MSEAIKLIVEGYLSLKDRSAIEEMRSHRQRLRKQVQECAPGGIDVGPTVEALDEDLRVIEAAISRH
jgi:KaiC/GvpD/RAD55 family RecA-like ATPase